MNMLFDPHHSSWYAVWSGGWSLHSDSHFGKDYTYILKIKRKAFMKKAVLIVRQGITTAYFDTLQKDDAGKRIASVYSTNPEKIKELCQHFKKEADKILAFLDKYEHQETTVHIYQNYLKHIDTYYLPHFMVKYIVDYLDENLLEKYLPDLQEARVYAEPVFKRTEEFMVSMSKRMAKLTGYLPEHILCMTEDEMEEYITRGVLPAENILKERYQLTALLFYQGKRQLVTGIEAQKIEEIVTQPTAHDIIKGSTAYPGKATGVVRIVLDPAKSTTFREGDILVTGMTRPEFLPVMKKAAAIVTDAGGILSHAAITARELKKPCVIGTKNATKVLKDGDTVEVDADKGIVKKI